MSEGPARWHTELLAALDAGLTVGIQRGDLFDGDSIILSVSHPDGGRHRTVVSRRAFEVPDADEYFLYALRKAVADLTAAADQVKEE